jgi:putative DNA methylase
MTIKHGQIAPFPSVRRLIEVDLPIKHISEHALKEKSIRHGHISTLHVWWARRPLAACRAVICAALWPDPADVNCPERFKLEASMLMKAFRNKRGGKQHDWNDGIELREALLEFIADFANWNNTTNRDFLETSRALTLVAHESLGGIPGTRPLVVDSFAGGGSFPIEALRVGADAFGSDINPIPVLLNKVVLEYIPKHGYRLAELVREWGSWVRDNLEKEVQRYFHCRDEKMPPVAYLWARTIKCEGPGCGADIPLIRSLWLAKKGKSSIALDIIPDKKNRSINFEVILNATNVKKGTVKRGSATCPVCGYTTPVGRVREQLKAAMGGADNSRLLAVVERSNNEKTYRLPSGEDLEAVVNAQKSVRRDEVIPFTELPLMSGVFNVPIYGAKRWDLLFSSRQLLVAKHISDMVAIAADQMAATLNDPDLALAVKVLLLLARDKYLDFRTTLCAWISVGEKIGHTFGRQALGMIFDWAEGVPFGDISGSWDRSIAYLAEFIEMEAGSVSMAGTAVQADAQKHPLPDGSVQAFITDPPYYNAVAYSDLSDFFYVWLRKDLRKSFPSLFAEPVAPKENELCEMKGWDPVRYPNKDGIFYETGMRKAFAEGRRISTPSGIGVIVFAHKTTAGWESLLSALVDSGWVVTGSWPIDTERGGRLRAMNSAALASSVHLVCRPREESNEAGDWRDVLAELPKRIHAWMPRLATEGVVGADAIFACLGPALEVFSRYSHVEKASGEQVTLKEYLEQVWAAVAKEALNMIFEGADATGFEEDARLTAMWLWTLSTGNNGNGKSKSSEADDEIDDEDESEKAKKAISGYALEYDAARKIAQGLGAHLEKLSTVVEVKGETAHLLPVSERTRFLFGKDETQSPSSKRKKKEPQLKLGFVKEIEEIEIKDGWGTKSLPRAGSTVLDRLHQSMILFAAGRSEALKRFLVEEGAGNDQRFWRLAQALSALYPKSSDEKRWVDGVLARKKGLGF